VLTVIIFLNPKFLFKIKESNITYSNYSDYSSYSSYGVKKSNRKSKKIKIAEILARGFGFVIGILIFVYFVLPSLLDIPILVKKDYSYVTGIVQDVKTERRDLNEYVYINGLKLNFFLGSNIEKD
jgi:hypothetical protein